MTYVTPDALLDAWRNDGKPDWDEWLAEQRIVRDESEIPEEDETA